MKSIKDIFRSYAVLDSDGRHTNGTDKESNHHYGDAYERIIDNSFGLRFDDNDRLLPSRSVVSLMMEVGVADGSSLLAWSEVFPSARCVGLDIHVAEKIAGGRYNNTEFHLGDQCKREDCERAAGGRQFDFIVEDATHKLENSLLTLFWLWPFVRPGGIYVVEEWDGIDGDKERIRALFPFADIVGTCGPHIADEPLVVFRKPLK